MAASTAGDGAKVTLLILAGGSSRRMGTDKLLLPVPPVGVPLVRHVAERLLPLAAKVVVVANDPGIFAAVRGLGREQSHRDGEGMCIQTAVNCLADDEPGKGPLGGLATGLRDAEDWALTVAGDMPLISAACCRHLIDLSGFECDAVVPVFDGQAQPLHAVYSRRCLPSVERALAGGMRRMDSFWKEVRVRTVEAEALRAIDPGLHTFTNINTPTEWEKARALLSQG